MLREKLERLGYALPPLPSPLASYMPAKLWGESIFVSGQLPIKEGKLLMTAPLMPGCDLKQAKQAMLCCFLNALAAAQSVCPLQREISGVLRLGAYVASDPAFTEQHLVADGASEAAKAIFGEEGLHARFALGVASLPRNASMELELIFLTSKKGGS